MALIGNPNTGKSTLFNALTGLRQRAANFPGVTVECVEGSFRLADGREVRVLDLPGSYSLSPHAADEAIALDVLMGRVRGAAAPDVIVVVVDAEQLERNLFLVSQLLELGLPLVVALNKMDVAERDGARIDVPELIHELGATVVPVVATTGLGVDHLRRVIAGAGSLPAPSRRFALPEPVAKALAPVERRLRLTGLQPSQAALHALRFVGDPLATRDLGERGDIADIDTEVARSRAHLELAGLRPDAIEAELRYGWIAGIVERAVSRATPRGRTVSDRVDAVLLDRRWGPAVFVVVMALMFQAVFSWSRPLTDGLEQAITAIGGWVGALLPPGDLQSLLVDGVVGGVGSVLAFVPQIFVLFLFIGLLEDSGYMARAAFVMDRFLRPLGLHGKSFIPLISGYACAVPAIMSARTVQDRRDRLATIMVVPLLSCSARLPVYTLLIGAFVPPTLVAGVVGVQGLALFTMYALGTLTALGAAALFRRTLLKGPMRPMIMELPAYRVPNPRALLTSVWHRVQLFLRRAGTVIFALSIVLWAMAAYPRTSARDGLAPAAAQEEQLANSALGRLGHLVEPVVRPLGFDWKIGVAV
ncbi:MAG TPA: ferrous iron transport protein B, partial [Gemmatimonadaceae bacterium]|nr:ferrous iron transport protein B [Gemmatimonadaceae bacterium]